MEEGRRRTRGGEVRALEGRRGRSGGGSSLGSCSEGVGQHERQDVMVYSAQEWGGDVDKVCLALNVIYSSAGRRFCPPGSLSKHREVICINVDHEHTYTVHT